ncbi:outer membrane-stress sensor serine endopeptidase DegS [Vibrio sp. SCSIO 43136]|uniref:outer membrane-stress sensor serine endopeptidase DegS n=1 Tax=Vibrio sp. SCSIO 43136 TaxID=2819101 RepID=UPI0020752853|nr:outer membrane-stress sensor serine endopeptidase DegS [Vibrio sp. SCSIO 43136]USD64896.1 outer membrane-stress sensor serine endopeptidase DegS [Vibrio sp. SCSIO 43136]
MVKFIMRSTLLGLATAAILLVSVPSLRQSALNIPTPSLDSTIGALQVSFSSAVRRAGPAVVNIYSRQYIKEDKLELKTQGLGSGVIVSEKGYIITNYHVIAEADQIIVALQDGRYSAANLIGKDRRTDIAVLKIEMTGLPVIPLNPEYQPNVGDVVLAIGNPYNLGQTTTFGIISATGRSSISADGRQAFIQTDAAINQGNSGGALVNTSGELVGINTASFQQATDLETYGISFAIPYSLANTIMEKIIADGRVIRGYIGIDGQDINAVSARLLGGDYVGGIIVMGIDPTGPAALAGFQKQDVILEIDGQKINGRDSVLEIVAQLRPGTEVKMTVLRKGELMTMDVIVGDDPKG